MTADPTAAGVRAGAASVSAAPVWQVPEPRRAPETRAEVGSWLQRCGADFYLANSLIGRHTLLPLLPLKQAAERFAREERQRVMDGPLYWVSPEMTELAVHAGAQLPTRELYRHDLPSAYGFMLFSSPIGTYLSTDQYPVQIVAASWGPWTWAPPEWSDGGILLTFYSNPAVLDPAWRNPAVLRPDLKPHDPQALLDALKHEAYQAWDLPPVMPDNECGHAFGPREDLDEDASPTGTTGEWAMVMLAAWLLMQQPLTTRETQRADRKARRRMQRAEATDHDVQLIHIRHAERRQPQEPATSGATRHYTHRWWVTGHWRTYHTGPGRAEVKRKYITPHTSGPKGLPLRGTNQVRVWDR